MGGTIHFAIPGDLDTPTGGYGYDRRLVAELPKLGWSVEHIRLPDGFPNPDSNALAETAALLDRLSGLLMIDGLAFGAMPEIAEILAGRLRLVALIHHPLADETGLSSSVVARLEESERRSLRFARQVICTSRTTAERLISDFDVEPSRLTVAFPGTDRQRRKAARQGPPTILSLAAIVPRKGHEVLISALSKLAGRAWTRRIGRALDRGPGWGKILKTQTAKSGLADRIVFVGPVTDPAEELRAADIFALPSRHEGYGMAFAEALAHGLPIIACRAGAVPEVVPPEAGFLVPVDDTDAFVEALATLLDNDGIRMRMSETAWRAAHDLPDWKDTARNVVSALERAAS